MKKPTRFTPLQMLMLAALGFAILIQFVPYGHNHQNPAVVNNPTWTKPEARSLAINACFDCHSNQTTYPWYSNVAPVSWLVQHHIDEARGILNFSDWNNQTANRAARAIGDGRMPPPYYTLMHPLAKLSDSEKQTLIAGILTLKR